MEDKEFHTLVELFFYRYLGGGAGTPEQNKDKGQEISKKDIAIIYFELKPKRHSCPIDPLPKKVGQLTPCPHGFGVPEDLPRQQTNLVADSGSQ